MDSAPNPASIWTWTLAATPPDRTTLSRVLLAYRAATGLTQAQLGVLLGLTQPHVSRLERGDRTIRDIRVLEPCRRDLSPAQSVIPPMRGSTSSHVRPPWRPTDRSDCSASV